MSSRGDPEALRAEIERLRTITDLMGAAVTLCSADLRYIWVSRAYGAWIGRPVEEMIGQPIVDTIGDAAFATIRPHIERVLAGERVEHETEVDLPKLGRRTVRASLVPTAERDGWVAVIEDVTGRRELAETQSRLAAIVENSDDAIVSKTLDGIVTSWNRGAEKLFQYTAEEMIGQPILRIVPPGRADDVNRILATIRRGERVDHYETERMRKDGSILAVSLTVSPIRDARGRIVGASKIARDVTTRREAEAARTETLEVLATLNETSALLSAELDRKKLVQRVTDAATELTGARIGAFFYNAPDEGDESYLLYADSGAPAEAFDGLPMAGSDVFAPTFKGEGVVRLDDVRKDLRYAENPPHFGIPSGHLAVASYLAVPMVLRGKVLGGLFFGHPDPGVFTERDERVVVGLAAQAAIAMDNSWLYEAERGARAEAEAANRSKDEFLSMVSHELRTPLASMLSWVAVLRQGKLAPEQIQRALETIERSGKVQAELINDLLDVSRVMSGRLKIELADIDLGAVLAAGIEGVRPEAAAKRVHLDASIEPGLIVSGDSLRLQQVVSNMLNNAIKFTPAGGSVSACAKRAGRSAAVVVRDSGKGIAADFLPRVFDAFSQADDVRRRKGGGIGIGLAIVKSLVEQHGGTVAAESGGAGAGATFTITLPLAEGMAARGAAEEVERAEREGVEA
jgi:PAS domain S-box-containing protein